MKGNFVYIASPLRFTDINKMIAERLDYVGVPYFLPETINLKDALDNLKLIGDICFDNIDKADIMVVVSPFGLGTASEIGYAINKKRRGRSIRIILYDSDKTMYKLDAAITPYFDYVFYSADSLIEFILSSNVLN